MISFLEERMEESLKLNKKALKMREEIKEKFEEVDSLLNLSEISMKIKKFDDAKQFCSVSLITCAELGYDWGSSSTHLSLSNIELSSKNYSPSLYHLKNSFQGFSKLEDE